MNIELYKAGLDEFFRNESAPLIPGTLLGGVRKEIIEMAYCYRDDGERFARDGDPVNALACYAYASGWIDTGCYTGLFTSSSPCKSLIHGDSGIPQHLKDHLEEKSRRYQRLLEEALASCVPVAETGVIWHEGAMKIILIARTYLSGGSALLGYGRSDDGLACFSYGHGWLDAALRTGLIRITGNKEVFAI